MIQGSSTLYPQLIAAELLDRLTLMTFPVVLGSGKRLFGDGTPAKALRLVDHKVTPSGAVIATYEPSGGEKQRQVGDLVGPTEPAERHRGDKAGAQLPLLVGIGRKPQKARGLDGAGADDVR